MKSTASPSGNLPLTAFAGFLERFTAALAVNDADRALNLTAEALASLADGGSVYVGFYRRDAPPIVLDFAGPDEWNRVYPNGYYLLDPTYEAFLTGSESVCLLPGKVFPGDFRNSEYYLTYYRPYGMVDEICFLLYLTPDLAAYISMMRLDGAPPFTAAETRRLSAALPAMQAVAAHVWKLHAGGSEASEGAQRELHRHLAAAYDSFGRDKLSDREADVTRLLLKGLSPKAVGRLLKIAPGTVRNHIKRIYVKLEVRSQAELLAYFFEVLGDSAVRRADG